jgi:hypothetical protein
VRLTAEIRYDAPPADVFAMVSDQRFQDEVCAATGAVSHSVTVERSADGGATVTTSRDLPTDGFPDYVKGFVGATLTVRRVDVWGPAGADGSRTGTMFVEIPGAPVRLDGTVRMAPQGGGTLEEVDGDLKASIPLLGGKVERAAEPAVRAAISKEQEVGRAWLTR